jgi:hypothetical protein
MHCLVLAQDKVIAAGFIQAVKEDLNEAADLLTAKSGIEDVLLIVNVIGASDLPRSQSSLRFPQILVCNAEVDDFYSVNFSPMIHFPRLRASLST